MSELAPFVPATPLEDLIVAVAVAVGAAGEPITTEAISAQIGIPVWAFGGLYSVRSLEDADRQGDPSG